MIVSDADALMRRYSAVIAPTSATGARPRDAVVQPPIPPPPREPARRGIPRINSMANLAGLPGINIPCGFDAEGMPLCLQIVGAAWDDQSVLDLAMAFQEETGWHNPRRENGVATRRGSLLGSNSWNGTCGAGCWRPPALAGSRPG